jgi:pyridoxine 5-phosphate synthase
LNINALKLGVNVDHVATLRQVRGTTYPDPLAAMKLCAAAGAHSVTVHLREDRRHIQDADVFAIRKADVLPLNLEMANAPEIVRIALRVKPDEVCIVPERRAELTTEGGLDIVRNRESLAATVDKLSRAGIRVSLFIAPDAEQIDAAVALGAPVIELHTGTFCEATGRTAQRELKRLVEGAAYAGARRLQVNAGHGINLANIRDILQMPHLDTLNIGHSIVAHAVETGMKEAVRAMIAAMADYAKIQFAREAEIERHRKEAWVAARRALAR